MTGGPGRPGLLAWGLTLMLLPGCILIDIERLELPLSATLYRVILPVGDIEAAAAFYEALFEAQGERVSPGRHYLNMGGVILALYDPVADGDAVGDGWRHHENQYLYFAVDDLEAAVWRARQAGAAALSDGIESMPWGERLFYARDPFGNPICLVDEDTRFTGDAGG